MFVALLIIFCKGTRILMVSIKIPNCGGETSEIKMISILL
jgi:hypothetical protein